MIAPISRAEDGRRVADDDQEPPRRIQLVPAPRDHHQPRPEQDHHAGGQHPLDVLLLEEAVEEFEDEEVEEGVFVHPDLKEPPEDDEVVGVGDSVEDNGTNAAADLLKLLEFCDLFFLLLYLALRVRVGVGVCESETPSLKK